MGLFSSTPRKRLPWIDLESLEDLSNALAGAESKPVLFFKHSTRCSISSMLLNSLEGAWTSENELCDLYFLDLLKHRSISNEIAKETGVTHQSPQVIVMSGSEVLYSASHSSIDARRIEQTLKSI
jgi:bacillithiol system protein YtxJ